MTWLRLQQLQTEDEQRILKNLQLFSKALGCDIWADQVQNLPELSGAEDLGVGGSEAAQGEHSALCSVFAEF